MTHKWDKQIDKQVTILIQKKALNYVAWPETMKRTILYIQLNNTTRKYQLTLLSRGRPQDDCYQQISLFLSKLLKINKNITQLDHPHLEQHAKFLLCVL